MASRGEATEWDEIQARLGNRDPIKKVDKAVNWTNREKAEREAKLKELESLVMRNLDELEEDDDEAVLRAFREKRMAELKLKQLRERFGELVHLSEVDYKREVTEETAAPVVVLLTKPGVPGCDVLEGRLRVLAPRFRATKFVSIHSEAAVRGYPDANLPTLLVYFHGDIRGQLVGMDAFGVHSDADLTLNDVEWALLQLKAIEGSELHENPRAASDGPPSSGSRSFATAAVGGGALDNRSLNWVGGGVGNASRRDRRRGYGSSSEEEDDYDDHYDHDENNRHRW